MVLDNMSTTSSITGSSLKVGIFKRAESLPTSCAFLVHDFEYLLSV